MKYYKFYLEISIFVACLQIIEGFITITNIDTIHTFSAFISLIELLWVAFSVITLIINLRNKLSIISPLSFVTYNVLGWIIGAALFNNSSVDVYSNVWVFIAGSIFGAYFLFINIKLLRPILNKK
ncbi:hypothetical protein OB236_10870 [Paenibacillus sp. WQ 127069]|uniref:Uncharacterized protein n=1 Tax=Paenibacillus baimaensis TaxID=2982185 RepID=A0ABT2UDE6_9BACL|nr:hypothetical protein [Paenibacillus sp. WQ 127069]MCU6792622.1 hypothetical protein [Paenibacillus sp. WQ 127069]